MTSPSAGFYLETDPGLRMAWKLISGLKSLKIFIASITTTSEN